ncbi:yop-1, partial [Symbiodinium necroappetens]
MWDGEHPLDFGLGKEAITSAADEVKPESFSIALSGGGIRAAAFQAGVLWRLAHAEQLQDVEYLAAVSGGGYLASSFASHLAAAERQPQTGATRQEVADFYLDVLAKTFCRMQRNAGGFLRDPTAGPRGESSWRIAFRLPRDGSGMLPRIFDGMLLLLTLATTLALNPLQITVVWLVPFTEALNVFYGTALRIAFCAQSLPHWQILWDWSPYGTFLRFFELTAGVNFAFWLLSRFAKRASSSASPRCYLFVNGCLACAARFLGVMLLLLVMIFALPYVEDWSVPESGGLTLQQRFATCEKHFRAASPSTSGCENADVFAEAGRSVDEYIRFNASAVQRGITQEVQAPELPESSTAVAGPDVAVFLVFRELLLKGDRSVLITFFGILVFLLTVTVLFAPFLPSLFISVVTITGPLLGLTMIMLMLQYRIYGPLTGQALMFGQLPFSEVKWRMFVRVCLMAGIVVVPFHNELRRLWHWYYLRTLQRNFFHGGKDLPFSKLAEQPLCPLLILTGTVTDYRRLGKQTWPRLLLDRTQTIAEISFTALHTGSTATGFIRTTYFRTLAKCTALTGAGCLDALSLSMSNRLRFRFWLEILNLSWGDYIFFSRRGANRYVERVANVLQTEAGRKFRWIAQQFPALFILASTQ